MPKQARLSGIKAARCYTIEEAAEVSGVSLRTIRNWAKNGLHVMDSVRPILIRGDALRDYIKAQRGGRQIQTRVDQFFCLPCRKARGAAGGMADCSITNQRATLTALCEVCETVMQKPVAVARIPEIARTLDLTITGQDTTL